MAAVADCPEAELDDAEVVLEDDVGEPAVRQLRPEGVLLGRAAACRQRRYGDDGNARRRENPSNQIHAYIIA